MHSNNAATDFVKAGVIGFPIKHSLSPAIHMHWLNKYETAGSYEHIEIHPDDFDERISQFKAENLYSGFNVTLPFKERIMDYCDEIDDTARQIGAVNTIILKKGKMIGKNTDAFGFIENLNHSTADYNYTDMPVLVLGAGGAARAVIYGLRSAGAKKIYIANRTISKSQVLADDFSNDDCCCEVVEWDKRLEPAHNCGLVVNTTSLGMTSKSPLIFDVSVLPENACVYDIVYTPLYTDILNDAKNRNLKVVTGIGMLLHQARPAFQAWFDIMPDVDDDLIAKIMPS